jgi:hypothetical protein
VALPLLETMRIKVLFQLLSYSNGGPCMAKWPAHVVMVCAIHASSHLRKDGITGPVD